jgi:hypothetical protein
MIKDVTCGHRDLFADLRISFTLTKKVSAYQFLVTESANVSASGCHKTRTGPIYTFKVQSQNSGMKTARAERGHEQGARFMEDVHDRLRTARDIALGVIAVAAVTCVTLWLSPVAHADSSTMFTVENTRVSCVFFRGGGYASTVCQSAASPFQKPDHLDCGGNRALGLKAHKRSYWTDSCQGAEPDPDMVAGETRKSHGVTCKAFSTGIKCANKSHHGFRITDSAVRRF